MSLSFYWHATRHDLRLVLAVAAVFVVGVNQIASPLDFAADFAGVTVACLLFLTIRLFRREKLLRSVTQT